MGSHPCSVPAGWEILLPRYVPSPSRVALSRIRSTASVNTIAESDRLELELLPNVIRKSSVASDWNSIRKEVIHQHDLMLLDIRQSGQGVVELHVVLAEVVETESIAKFLVGDVG